MPGSLRSDAGTIRFFEGTALEARYRLFYCLIGILLGCGCLMVYSSSMTSRPTEFEQVYLSRHLIFLGLGLLLGWGCSRLPAAVWFTLSPWLLLLTVLLLGAVLVPGIGTRVQGAQRWFRFGSVSFQPSELAKITLPLFLARLVILLRRKDWLTGWFTGTLPILLPLLLVVPLVALEPDLGTSAFLVLGVAVLLFVGGWPLRNFLLGGAVVVPVAAYSISRKPYQLDRIRGFLRTWVDFEQAPYQVKQALLALGVGGVQGTGIGQGWQKLSFLPESNTDFVFAVVGEELGLLGTLGVLTVWTLIYLSGLNLFHPLERDSFPFLAGVTLLTQIVMQAALNVAVVTAMVPPKGISHPLLSYGGSNLVMTLIALGIIVSLSRTGGRVAGKAVAS